MKRNNKSLLFILGLALTTGLSCTGGEFPLASQLDADTSIVSPPPDAAPTAPVDTGTTTPSDTAPPEPVDTASVPPVDSGGPPLLNSTLLSCRPQPYAVTTAMVGPKGGLIMFGNHALKIYEGALSDDVTITAEQVDGAVNSVRFSPEGLRFAVPAVLSLSYKNCDNVRHYKKVVYTDEQLNILEPTLSLDFNNSSQVKSLIYHFSRYAVAY